MITAPLLFCARLRQSHREEAHRQQKGNRRHDLPLQRILRSKIAQGIEQEIATKDPRSDPDRKWFGARVGQTGARENHPRGKAENGCRGEAPKA
jgi:hypothetical protein